MLYHKFIGGHRGPEFLLGGPPLMVPFEPPLVRPQEMDRHSITYMYFF